MVEFIIYLVNFPGIDVPIGRLPHRPSLFGPDGQYSPFVDSPSLFDLVEPRYCTTSYWLLDGPCDPLFIPG